MKKVVPKKFAKFTAKNLCQSLIYKKVVDLRHGILSKKRLRFRWFPVNFKEFLWALFLRNTSERLLRNINAHVENTDRNVVLDAAIHYVLSTDRLSTFRIFKSSIFPYPCWPLPTWILVFMLYSVYFVVTWL